MTDVSYRVIADHIRCLTFAITDGAIPSNEGRGYVLRRILRRAVRYGRQYMNMHEPFLCDLVEPLVEHMGDAFPELRKSHGGRNVAHVQEIIRDEEASFIKTLDRGIKLFSEAAEYARTHHHGKISGEDAFKLHDTYGFPIDLTELMAEEQGLTIDIGEYERLMEQARERARHDKNIDAVSEVLRIPREHLTSATDDQPKYIQTEVEASYLFPTGVEESGRDSWTTLGLIGLVFDRTCFYAEQGGQIGDRGAIEFPGFAPVRVENTLRAGELVVHLVDPAPLLAGKDRPQPGQRARLSLDPGIRRPTMKHHTSTHILNWALREILGDHVQQKGSLVDPEKTRFDFSHNKPLSDEEIERIEALCSQQIEANYKVFTREVEQKVAREVITLRAVFGEKYPDVVRVVSIGAPITEEDAKEAGEADWLLKSPKNERWMKYSVEFCGGTHLKTSHEAEAFVLAAEEGVAKGVRRVVGIAGELARQAIVLGDELLMDVEAIAKSPNRQIAKLPDLQQRLATAEIPLLVRRKIQVRMVDLQKHAKEQEKASAASSGEAVMDAVASLLAKAETVGGITIVVGEVPAANADALRAGIDWVRNKTQASAVLLASVAEGKVTFVAGMSKAAVERGLKAGDLIKEISPLVGGKGGGRPDMAQGGGPEAGGVGAALDAAFRWLRGRI